MALHNIHTAMRLGPKDHAVQVPRKTLPCWHQVRWLRVTNERWVCGRWHLVKCSASTRTTSKRCTCCALPSMLAPTTLKCVSCVSCLSCMFVMLLDPPFASCCYDVRAWVLSSKYCEHTGLCLFISQRPSHAAGVLRRPAGVRGSRRGHLGKPSKRLASTFPRSRRRAALGRSRQACLEWCTKACGGGHSFRCK